MHSSQGSKEIYRFFTLHLEVQYCNNFEILYTLHKELRDLNKIVEAKETNTLLVCFLPTLWGKCENQVTCMCMPLQPTQVSVPATEATSGPARC